jgi:hypothetical protein
MGQSTRLLSILPPVIWGSLWPDASKPYTGVGRRGNEWPGLNASVESREFA